MYQRRRDVVSLAIELFESQKHRHEPDQLAGTGQPGSQISELSDLPTFFPEATLWPNNKFQRLRNTYTPHNYVLLLLGQYCTYIYIYVYIHICISTLIECYVLWNAQFTQCYRCVCFPSKRKRV